MTSKEIYLLRTKHHKTQKEFAEIIGVHESTIRKWEAGLRNPRLIAIKALNHFIKEMIPPCQR